MKKRCAFTICTRSYIGLAKALKKSFLEFNDGYDFFIIIADYAANEKDKNDENTVDSREVIALESATYNQMAFQYNVTEFCTSIKPFAFKWAFNKGYDLAIYLDPDILVFSEFKEVGINHSLYLAPHILDIKPEDFGHWQEQVFTKHGVYNCGFVAIRNDKIGNSIVDWWSNKLINCAFSDIEEGMYTDQKWMDFVFSFVDIENVKIIKHLGYDVAPWNYHEREPLMGENYQVRLRGKPSNNYDLVFLHYSGYNYSKLISDNIIEGKYGSDMTKSQDYDFLVEYYRYRLVNENASEYLSIKYGYDFFVNGVLITNFNRRMFRKYIEEGNSCDNPFEIGSGSFYEVLSKAHMISLRKSMAEIKKSISANKEKKEKILRFVFNILYKFLGADKYYYFINKIHNMTKIEYSYFLLLK